MNATLKAMGIKAGQSLAQQTRKLQQSDVSPEQVAKAVGVSTTGILSLDDIAKQFSYHSSGVELKAINRPGDNARDLDAHQANVTAANTTPSLAAGVESAVRSAKVTQFLSSPEVQEAFGKAQHYNRIEKGGYAALGTSAAAGGLSLTNPLTAPAAPVFVGTALVSLGTSIWAGTRRDAANRDVAIKAICAGINEHEFPEAFQSIPSDLIPQFRANVLRRLQA